MSLDALPAPTFAERRPVRGPAVPRLDLAIRGMRRDLDAYGPAETDVLFLDDGARWETVVAFYADALTEAGLAGFERQPTGSGDPDRYRLAVWARGDAEALAVAMVPGAPDDSVSFLVRLLAPRP